MDDLKVELELKKNDLKSVEEALDEIELFDEEEDIPFLIGEVFLSHKLSRTQVSLFYKLCAIIIGNNFILFQELLQEAKEQTLKEIASIEAKANEIKSEMNELKAQLYQRFGSNISLESDDQISILLIKTKMVIEM